MGQIGNASSTTALYPVRINAAGKGIVVKAGTYASYVIRDDENVYSWGLNANGQLGQGTIAIVNTPKPINALFGVSALDAGNSHVAAITSLAHSCISSAVTIHVDTVPDVPVYVSGLTLYTTVQGTSYQWYYNGSLIPNATDSTLHITAQGVYSVLVTFANSCSSMSDGYNYQLGLDQSEAGVYTIFPNPSHGAFTIQLPLNSQSVQQIVIRDLLGQIIMTTTLIYSANQIHLELPDVTPGMYVIELMLGNATVVRETIVVN